MRERLGRSCPDPMGGQLLDGGALTRDILRRLVVMYYSTPSLVSIRWCWCGGFEENGGMSESRPTLQFDLDLEAVRLLHRSVSFHLEKWPGGTDPREQEALQAMKTLLTAALLEFSLDQDAQR